MLLSCVVNSLWWSKFPESQNMQPSLTTGPHISTPSLWVGLHLWLAPMSSFSTLCTAVVSFKWKKMILPQKDFDELAKIQLIYITSWCTCLERRSWGKPSHHCWTPLPEPQPGSAQQPLDIATWSVNSSRTLWSIVRHKTITFIEHQDFWFLTCLKQDVGKWNHFSWSLGTFQSEISAWCRIYSFQNKFRPYFSVDVVPKRNTKGTTM